jgi:hypothetical protein
VERLNEDDWVEVTLPGWGANVPRAPIGCHVLVADGRWAALEAVDKLATLRLPRAIDGAMLVFAHHGSLVALKGVVAVDDDVPGDLRFIAYPCEGMRRRRTTRAKVAVPVTVRRAETGAELAATIVNMSVSGALLESELSVSLGESLEVGLCAPTRSESATTLLGAAVVRRTDASRFAVEFGPTVAPDFRSEITRLVIEERRATRLRREDRLLATRLALHREF